MNEEQLKTFICIADCGSFSAAEEHRYISKQSMYKQIANLEEEAGCALLERTRTGVRLTEAGKIFYSGANSLLQQKDELLISCRKAAHAEYLRIGSVEHQVILHEVTKEFSKLYPEIEIRNVIHPNHSGEYRVSNNIMDVGETFQVSEDMKPDWMDCGFIPLFTRGFYAAMREGHPLANKKKVHLEDLTPYVTSIYLQMNSQEAREEYIQVFEENPSHMDIRTDVDHQVELAFSLMENNHILIGANPFIESISGLVTIPLQTGWKRTYGLIYHDPMTSTVKKYVEVALKYYHQPPLK